ncbi:MAG: hypothetical protein ACTHLE_24640 [Agriterribacter sp.]
MAVQNHDNSFLSAAEKAAMREKIFRSISRSDKKNAATKVKNKWVLILTLLAAAAILTLIILKNQT